MTDQLWDRTAGASAAEFDELCSELAATIDDHEIVHKKATRFQRLRLTRSPSDRKPTHISTKLRRLRRRKDSQHSWSAPLPATATSEECETCGNPHHQEFAPQRFDTVQHSLSAIRDLACYLSTSPQTIWLALESIFTARQTTSARNLVRHRLSVLARLLPTAAGLLILALVLLHFLLPEHTTDTGYTPIFSELGFLLLLITLSSFTFVLLTLALLVLKSTLQERFINAFARLVTWSIPIVLSFFMVSPEFLLLVQEVTGGNSENVRGIQDLLAEHAAIIETVYWTVLTYVALYTGTLLAYIAFANVFQEQRDYVHRHDVLRDVIPLLVAAVPTTRSHPKGQ